jgi:tetratricopeptide (TPR) repeat protein
MTILQFEPFRRTGLYQPPHEIADFTGREDAVRTVRGLLEPSGSRATVLAIAGRAGVGKTALANRVAHQMRSSFPDGQLYVNLRGPETQRLKPEEVQTELLMELGVPRGSIEKQLEARTRQYREQLAGGQVLLVLDNAAEEAQVQPLLPDSPGSAVLITSRKQLRDLGDRAALTLGALDPDEATELLGRMVGPLRVESEPEAAARIVALCGCLPLAIRIAGARFAADGDAPLAALASRLDRERKSLTRRGVNDLEVRAGFALNYENLDAEERRTFRLLGLVNAPDFPPWVASALNGSDPATTSRLITGLIAAEVLEMARITPNSEVRYRLHDVLRVLARERLAAEEPTVAEEAALRDLLQVSLGLAGRGAELLEPGPEQQPREQSSLARFSSVVDRLAVDPASWFERERFSLLAATEQACQRGLLETTWELARAQTYFLKLRTHWTDWRHMQVLARLASQRDGNRRATANALRSLGDVYTQLGQLKRAVARLERASAIFGELDDGHGLAWTLVGLGNALREQGLFSKAIGHFLAARDLFDNVGDLRGQAWSREGLGVLYRQQGKFPDCLAQLEEGLELFRQIKDRRGEAYCLVILGTVERDKGRVELALGWFDQAAPIFRRLADRHGETFVLLNKGHMLREQGAHAEAARIFRDCLEVFEQLSDDTGMAWTIWNLGMAQHGLGDDELAMSQFRQALDLFTTLGDRRGVAWTFTGLGLMHLDRGQVEEARTELDLAVSALREIGDALMLARALRARGSALLKPAVAAWTEALEIFQRLEAPEASEVSAQLSALG